MQISLSAQCVYGSNEWLRAMDGHRSELGAGADGLGCMIGVENIWMSFRFFSSILFLFLIPGMSRTRNYCIIYLSKQ